MIAGAETVVLLLVALVGGMLGLMLLWRYPIWIALVALLLPVVHESFQFGPDALNLGAATLYMEDIACLLLLTTAAVVIWRTRKLPEKKTWPVLGLFSLAMMNCVRGAFLFGLKPAGNSARTLMYFIVPLIAVIALGPILRTPPQRLARGLVGLACLLCLAAVFRWTGTISIEPTGPCATCGSDVQVSDKGRELPRALPAEYAILIGQSMLGIIYLQLTAGVSWYRFLGTAGLAALTFTLQHRSVWVATFIALLWLAGHTVRSSRKSWMQMLSMGAGMLLLLGLMASPERVSRVRSMVIQNVDETRYRDSTWHWRLLGFEDAISRLFSSAPIDVMLGPPSGEEDEFASEASVHIHSRYVATLAYYGLLGFGLLIGCLAAIGKRIGRHQTCPGELVPMSYPIDQSFLQALFISQLMYFAAYSGGMMQGALAGFLWLSGRSALRVVALRPGMQFAIHSRAKVLSRVSF